MDYHADRNYAHKDQDCTTNLISYQEGIWHTPHLEFTSHPDKTVRSARLNAIKKGLIYIEVFCPARTLGDPPIVKWSVFLS